MDQESQIFKIETAYNSLRLVRHQGRLELRGKDRSLQSVIDPETPHRLALANLEYLVSVLLFLPPPGRILILGTAAGSLLHFLRHHYPGARITAVDIDEALVGHMLDLGILPPADDCLAYVYDDAANYLEHCHAHFDLVLVDIFRGAHTPAWLLSRECIQILRALASEPGAVAYNLLVDSDHDFGRFYREFRRQFRQQALSMPVVGLENRIVYGLRGETAALDLPGNLRLAQQMSARLGIDFVRIMSVIYNTNPAGTGLL